MKNKEKDKKMSDAKEMLLNQIRATRAAMDTETLKTMDKALAFEAAKKKIYKAFKDDTEDKRRSMLNTIRAMMVHDEH